LALTFEKPEKNVMQRMPRKSSDRLINWKLLAHAYLLYGVITFFGCTISYFWYMASRGFPFSGIWFGFNGLTGTYPASDPFYPNQPIDANSSDPNEAAYASNYITDAENVGASLYFVSTVICQWGTSLAIRTRYESITVNNPFFGKKRNLRLVVAYMAAIMFLLILTLVPWFQNVFATAQVPVMYACAAIGYASLILIIDESRKYVVRNRPQSWIAKMAW